MRPVVATLDFVERLLARRLVQTICFAWAATDVLSALHLGFSTFVCALIAWVGVTTRIENTEAAIAAGTRSAETDTARSEGCQSDPKGIAQTIKREP
jgi:hypothetical protein